MERTVSARETFAIPTFQRLWFGAQTSNLGSLIQAVGAAWLMTSLTASESMVALVQTAQSLPIMVFALSAGVFADSYDRRKVMLAAQGFMALMGALLTILAFTGGLNPLGLLAFTFLIGCGTALHNPSWQASVGDVVPKSHVPFAISLNAMGFNIVRSIGPAVGGVVVAVGGAASAFALNFASYTGILWALWKWRPAQRTQTLPREDFGGALLAGLRYVAMSPNLVNIVLRTTLFGTSAVAVQALLPIVVQDRLGGGAIVFGGLLGCFGLGAVVTGLNSGRIRARFAKETIAATCFAGLAGTSLAMALSTGIALSALAMIIGGGSWLMMMSLTNATVQMSTPRWVVGRTVALYQTGAFGGMAAGAWAWGQLAEATSTPTALTAAAATLAAGAVIGRLVPLPDYEGLNIDPLDQHIHPDPHIDMTARSGPIMVTVFYDVAPDQISEFQKLMARRRRIRLRDGARRWTLLRDIETPTRWVEVYHVPTWGDYQRHHARRTQADRSVTEALNEIAPHEESQRLAYRLLERPVI